MTEDIYSHQCNLIGQINGILCYFRDLDSIVKARLMKRYHFSMYGCVLWDFNNTQVDSLQSMAQGNEMVFYLPYDSHSFILPVLSLIHCLCFMKCASDLCFITKCMYGSSALVQSVVMHSIHGMGFTSVITRNISTVCNLFGWSPGDFIRGKVYQCMITTV